MTNRSRSLTSLLGVALARDLCLDVVRDRDRDRVGGAMFLLVLSAAAHHDYHYQHGVGIVEHGHVDEHQHDLGIVEHRHVEHGVCHLDTDDHVVFGVDGPDVVGPAHAHPDSGRQRDARLPV